LKSLFTTVPEPVEGQKIDPFRLTKEQADIVKALDQKIVCDVDKKTMMITINVTDQDPVICAQMADSVQMRLQEFITQYRTKKARVDLEYNKKLFAEAKARYEKARKQYAGFSDANQRVFLESVQSQKSALANEMQLQYQAYSQVSAQLMAAEAKVQEDTPAFTTLQDATVPVQKSGPKRGSMCILFTFLAFLGTSIYILYTTGELKSLFSTADKSPASK
jgi:capsule polysaccharide export protein KpsE/RkpR